MSLLLGSLLAVIAWIGSSYPWHLGTLSRWILALAVLALFVWNLKGYRPASRRSIVAPTFTDETKEKTVHHPDGTTEDEITHTRKFGLEDYIGTAIFVCVLVALITGVPVQTLLQMLLKTKS